MKSTGEVMGIDSSVGIAFAKSQLAAGQQLPAKGNVLISVRDADKAAVLPLAQRLLSLGFCILATSGTAAFLSEHNVDCSMVNKISHGRPHILDKVQDKQIQWIINTSLGSRTTEDSYSIRRSALDYHLPYTTTTSGLETVKEKEIQVKAIQEYF
jgi:carbamoyl-phosphate synthase large subunit